MAAYFFSTEKQCTVEEWREFYSAGLKTRLAVSPYARIHCSERPDAVIVQRGGWSQNNTFSRCGCGGLKIYGICQKCGIVVVCSWCNRLVLADKKPGELRPVTGRVSHGICKKCYDERRPN